MKVPYYDDDDYDGDDRNKQNELRQAVKQFQIHFMEFQFISNFI